MPSKKGFSIVGGNGHHIHLTDEEDSAVATLCGEDDKASEVEKAVGLDSEEVKEFSSQYDSATNTCHKPKNAEDGTREWAEGADEMLRRAIRKAGGKPEDYDL